MRLFEHLRRSPAEVEQIALVLDAEAMDRNAVDVLVSGTRLVAPGDVVAGVRGQYVHLGMVRQVLGDVARMKLSAAANRLTVSLYDDRELHCSSSGPPCPELGDESGALVSVRVRVRDWCGATRPPRQAADPCGEPAGEPMMAVAGAPPRRPRRRRRRLLR